MFTTFRTGNERQDEGWDDTPIYAPGRFHAHALPFETAAEPSDSAAKGQGQRRGVTRRLRVGSDGFRTERSWLLRPGRERVEGWLDNWARRWLVLVGIPCVCVWLWCSVPFPVSDPYKDQPPWKIPWPAPPASLSLPSGAFMSGQITPTPTVSPTAAASTLSVDGDADLPVDANFWFFLFGYFGLYVAASLVFITKLFDLYRLNWWPTSLGGSVSYAFFWTLSLLAGWLLHHFHLDGLRRNAKEPAKDSSPDWERKTVWIVLAFASMALPAVACFAKLRADRRHHYRRSLTPADRAFNKSQSAGRMPRSYRRFLWFLLTVFLSLVALIVGQGFATIYLSTLPHSNLDGLIYVWTWTITVQCLNALSSWILVAKVRSRALLFCAKYYFFLVYHVFYRNLFARLRSPDQAIYIQLLSSSWVILWYPISMSGWFHRAMIYFFGEDSDRTAFRESVAATLYIRNLSENVTMVAFLGWSTILHFGPNKPLYPFFAFDSKIDPYTFRLTAVASLIIWATELVSSFLARTVIWFAYRVDVTNVGLDEFREHPELVVACVWASIHVLMDMLLFLIKLNFR